MLAQRHAVRGTLVQVHLRMGLLSDVLPPRPPIAGPDIVLVTKSTAVSRIRQVPDPSKMLRGRGETTAAHAFEHVISLSARNPSARF